MKKLISILLFVWLVGSIPFSFAQNEIEKLIEENTPKLQIEYIIQRSKDYAKNEGQKLEDYYIDCIKYDSSEKEWFISFMGKRLALGNHFGIIIKDPSEEIRLFLGK